MSQVADRISTYSPEKLRLLARRLKKTDGLSVAIRPRGRETTLLPLSYGQERLWFLDRLFPESATYNLPFALHFQFPETPGAGAFTPGLEDLVRLHRSTIDELVRRHEILRTSFPMRDGSPVQVVNPPDPVPPKIFQMEGVPDAERIDAARAIIQQNAQERFDLANGSPCRFGLIQLSPTDYIGFGVFHHIVFDAWSQKVAVEEFRTLVLSALSGNAYRPLELPIQYADYALWQRERWASEDRQERVTSYWIRQLTGIMPLELPADHPRPAVQSFRGRTESFHFPPELCDPLRHLSQRQGVTLFATLLAVWAVLLQRYTATDDVPVCIPVANRTHVATEGLIGFFVNTIVMRLDLSGDPTFAALQRRTWEICTQAYDNQEMPFERLVQELQPTRDLSRNPLSAISFQLQDIPTRGGEQAPASGINLAAFEVEAAGSAFDLDLTLSEQWDSQWIDRPAKGIRGKLTYNPDIFEPATVRRFIEHFRNLLGSAVNNPDRQISALEMLGEQERREIVIEWNRTEHQFADVTVPAVFEANAALHPLEVAVQMEDREVSYSELNRHANQLAHVLLDMGVGAEVTVGILAERSVEMVVGILAILKAGGAYIPLDPDYPAERLRGIAEEASFPVLLTQAKFCERLAFYGGKVVALDADWESLVSHQPDGNLPHVPLPESAAYVIYTSGSTGRPKGAINLHRGLSNRLQWMQSAYPLTLDDRVLQKTPYTFDVSVWELLWPLIAGARLVLARPGGHKDPSYLSEAIQRFGITTAHFVPSMLTAWLAREDAARRCTSLRRVLCSGEELKLSQQELFHSLLDAELHNLYGPSEASIDVTAWKCSSESPKRFMPIGRPISNIQTYVLDDRLDPVPVGVPGLLYIAGAGIGRGYLKRPDLTAASFLANSFADVGGERMYCTGDLARYDEAGVLEFLGRRDNQVKIRGFRIELGEIETVLTSHPSISQAAVIVATDHAGSPRLVAFVVHDAPADLDSLRTHLRERLPEYMVPAHFVALDVMPVNANGKLDRKALVVPEQLSAASQDAYAERGAGPRNPTEQLLVEIWQRLLNVESISIYESFFNLGGHSLLAVRLLDEVNFTFQAGLPLQSLFDPPTVAGLAGKIHTALTGEAAILTDSPLDLSAEAMLDPSILPRSGDERVRALTNVLLTGATGFLGAFLLTELMERTAAKVYCLVRAVTSQEGQLRIERHLRSLNLWQEEYSARIVVMCGDLSLSRFGLPTKEYEHLAAVIDSVYHNGAMVNFFYPYRVMRGANVAGTEEILRLACRDKQKSVHYISSMGVFPQASILPPEGEWNWRMAEEDESDWRYLAMGYTQSKWVAEQLVRRARERGIPVVIYRPTITYGHTETGHGNNRDFLYRLIFSCGQLGYAPDLDSDLNLVPIDFVTKGIVALSLQEQSLGRIFHLVNRNSTPLRKILDIVVNSSPIRRLQYEDWRARLIDDPDNVLAALARNFPERNSDTLRQREFDASNADSLLAETGIRCPGITDRMLQMYVDRILSESVGEDLLLAGNHGEENNAGF